MVDKKFVIVIPSFNNAKFFRKNLASVLNQNYSKKSFRILYFDDCSTDNTFEVVTNFLEKYNSGVNYKIIKNERNMGALYNIHNAIMNYCEPDEILVFLDGDDWQQHTSVLKWANNIFQNNNIWFCWSNYRNASNNRLGCSAPFSEEVYANNSFRDQSWRISHQHFGIAALFKKIPEKSLKYKDNQYFKTGWDIPLYCSTIELAGKHAVHIPEVTMIYNDLSELNDSKKDLKGQQKAAEYGFKMEKLNPLASL